MAGFCRRCGDIIRGPDSRCKCGGSSVSSQVTKAMFERANGTPKHDRWLKTYGERRSVSPASGLISRTQSKPTPPSQLNMCLSSPEISPSTAAPTQSQYRESLGNRSLNTLPSATALSSTMAKPLPSDSTLAKQVKRGLSVKSSAQAHVRSLTANMPDHVDLSAAEEEVLTNVFGSVLDPHETRGRCGACKQIFKREGKIYPDPRREDESGQWAGVFYCRKCYVQRFSRGKCASCNHTIVGDEGTYIQLGKGGCNGLWHKKCFKCVHCQTDVSDSPSVDLSGDPCCEECFEQPRSRNSTSKLPLVTDIPDLRNGRVKRTSIVNTQAAQSIKPAVEELRQKLRQAGIEKEPFRPMNLSPSRPNGITPSSRDPCRATNSATAVPLPSIEPLSLDKPGLKADTSRTVKNAIPSLPPTPKLGSASSQHVLSPAANPLCPTCKQSLFRPVPSQSHHNKSRTGLSEQLVATLATLPATGETFHLHCLTCDDCKEAFTNQKYVLLDNLKLCEPCVAQRDLAAAQKRLDQMKAELSKRRDNTVSTRFPDYKKAIATKEWHLDNPGYVSPSFPTGHSFSSSSQHRSCGPEPLPSTKKNALESPQRLKKVSTSPFLNTHDTSNSLLPKIHQGANALRFGGQTICPGCHKPGTMTETKLGPNNERWHFKCLKCAHCHKLLDSGAKTFDDSTEVGCRDCLGKARAKRRQGSLAALQ